MTSADNTAVPDYSSLLRLDGQGFIVIGAGQGMGRQTAHALASQGARVLCVDIDDGLAKEVADEVGGVAAVADVRREDDVAGVVAQAQREFGRLNGLADVVGMARYGALVDMPAEDWDWCHDMVVRHAFYLVKHGGKAIAAGGGGSMAFVASISGVSSAPYHGAYGVAKAGLISLVRTAAVELKSAQVRVNAVAPGNTATPRAARSRGPGGGCAGRRHPGRVRLDVRHRLGPALPVLPALVPHHRSDARRRRRRPGQVPPRCERAPAAAGQGDGRCPDAGPQRLSGLAGR